MTIKYKLTKMYHKKRLITVCCVSFQEFINGKTDTLEHLVDDVWIELKPPLPRQVIYDKYSHSISPKNLKRYYPKLYEKLMNSREQQSV